MRCIAAVLAGRSLGEVLDGALDAAGPASRGFAQDLCLGTLRAQPRLQWILDQLLRRPLRQRDGETRALLLAGLYQLGHGRTPANIVVSESVDCARSLGRTQHAGLVNAVLRGYLRRKEEFSGPDLPDSARYAMPEWLLDALREAWPERWSDIATGLDRQAPLTLRVNRRRATRDDMLRALADAGHEARPGTLSADAIHLGKGAAVPKLPGFRDGRISVQDEGAQLAATLLDAGPGDRVLDACAAPGGKSAHTLERADVELTAIDSSAQRMQRVIETLERLGLRAETIVADAADTAAWWDGRPFQRILLDAPCTATGVIRRHPDIKLLRRAADVAGLAAVQLALLRALWPTLAPGGRLLYATCSLLPGENDVVLAEFLREHGDARHRPLAVEWGEPRPLGRQLLPEDNGHDGFYYALLEKS